MGEDKYGTLITILLIILITTIIIITVIFSINIFNITKEKKTYIEASGDPRDELPYQNNTINQNVINEPN